MLQAADERRWGWFVAVLLLGAVGSLTYGLAQPAATVEKTSALGVNPDGRDLSRPFT